MPTFLDKVKYYDENGNVVEVEAPKTEKTLYQHNITIRSKSLYLIATLSLITTNQSSMAYSDINNWLNNQGFTVLTYYYPTTGCVYLNGTILVGVISSRNVIQFRGYDPEAPGFISGVPISVDDNLDIVDAVIPL